MKKKFDELSDEHLTAVAGGSLAGLIAKGVKASVNGAKSWWKNTTKAKKAITVVNAGTNASIVNSAINGQ